MLTSHVILLSYIAQKDAKNVTNELGKISPMFFLGILKESDLNAKTIKEFCKKISLLTHPDKNPDKNINKNDLIQKTFGVLQQKINDHLKNLKKVEENDRRDVVWSYATDLPFFADPLDHKIKRKLVASWIRLSLFSILIPVFSALAFCLVLAYIITIKPFLFLKDFYNSRQLNQHSDNTSKTDKNTDKNCFDFLIGTVIGIFCPIILIFLLIKLYKVYRIVYNEELSIDKAIFRACENSIKYHTIDNCIRKAEKIVQEENFNTFIKENFSDTINNEEIKEYISKLRIFSKEKSSTKLDGALVTQPFEYEPMIKLQNLPRPIDCIRKAEKIVQEENPNTFIMESFSGTFSNEEIDEYISKIIRHTATL